ncbi:hybrid sensor histidine kinase/response regulator [Brevibacillus borstelensis]|uniref:hybrid sensor histidine kinase/response regulator n=1 Tax=Brevibacillus borstelensis TaxID=45462 RepID=UPI0030BD4447
MMQIFKKPIFKYVVTTILFVSLLLSLRLLWSEMFHTAEHPHAARGVLDMRGWPFETAPTIALKGEWEFYPGAFVSHEDIARLSADSSRYVQVPGDWRSAFPEGAESSFGYGTYRLRILIDKPLEQPYAFWFRDLEASSIVEINGKVEAAIGQPAKRAEEYWPRNVSYTATYTSEGTKEIELLVRIANFDNPVEGGIVRSIRFGSQAALDTERWYSIGFQLVTFIVLILHSMYACILYLFNPRRQKAFLVFFLLLVATSISVVSDHDYLLGLWIPMDYAWALKIKLLSYMWMAFFILLMARIFSGQAEYARLFLAYTAILVLYSGVVLAASPPLIYYTVEAKAFTALYVFPLVWFVCIIARMIIKNQQDAIFLQLTATSIISSAVWGMLNYHLEITSVYYPIDVFAAIVGFSAYWFKKYFRNSEENIKLNEQLTKADKMKDQFLANTSHELRTPLHGIMNIARNIATKQKHAMDAESLEDLELLITVSRRMSHLLDDLLDIVRIKENRILLQKEPLTIQSVVSGVFGMLRFMTEGKPVQLKTEIDESMPPVLADEKRLVQILFNLLHNALKFTEEGTVAVSAKARNGRAVIYVSDTGPGMDEETQGRVFMPYEQGAYEKGDGRGIGLGLSICKQLVELHGGELTVRSGLGKGAVFSFSIPLAAPHSLPAKQGLSAPQTEAFEETAASRLTSDAGSNERTPRPLALLPFGEEKANILIVDDDPVNLKVLAGILTVESYNVGVATSAREALQMLYTRQWDLLISDVMMPHMSGYELTQKVRERFSASELPVLLLTARSEPEDIYTGFMSGANDYVTKPVDALELKYRIWSLIALKQSVKERLRMEAAYLQAQIHPHFLFNTLNSLMALSDLDIERMRKLGDAFTSYLRISFDFLSAGKLVELSHELELVRAYLYIEKERFEERLSIQWEVDPDLDLLLPPLTIQPLVENAVRHGVLRRARGGTVQIRIACQDRSALIEVKDDGIGMEQDKVRQLLDPAGKSKAGIGLSNTNRRLTQLYGQGLSVQSKAGEGTSVSFVIPDRGRRLEGGPQR